MSEQLNLPEQLVFGLDIGTRSIVGTVGYLEKDTFHVAAQYVKPHETRAMIDGQIHDIVKVGETIRLVKEELERKIDRPLTEVCIAAAGRVLRTVTTSVEMEYEEETVVNQENIYSLDLLGIEQAQKEMQEQNETDMHFYCVGYSVIHYYLNGYAIGNLEGHKATKAAEDLIATFLPDEVVDGLYAAVAQAGLEVANLTLEPIAAINVAIPEKFRMLNIGLIDVGAGTSDICITKDGSIIAYGMIPMAGDELTEVIARQYLVDFDMAEHIKTSVRHCFLEKQAHPNDPMPRIAYEDILGISHEAQAEEICELLEPTLDQIAKAVAEKMKELNADKSVSAVFVVGGGGKIPGFTDKIAKNLGLIPERVALRGEEVMGNIHFYQENIKKDSLLVTPIGICLNYYDKKNNFIFVYFNGNRMKLYNNSHLTVVEAAMQAGFPNDGLFPKRGRELNYTVNGRARMLRGQIGELAVITINGRRVDLNTAIESNDHIEIQPSTAGTAASLSIEALPEFHHAITVTVNQKRVECPVFVEANGALVSGFYDIKENDEITVLNYYTLSQILEYMDVILPFGTKVYINNKPAEMEERVYDNFTVDWNLQSDSMQNELTFQDLPDEEEFAQVQEDRQLNAGAQQNNRPLTETAKSDFNADMSQDMTVYVNQKPVILSGKQEYRFVDIFDVIDFDVSKMHGSSLTTKINGAHTNGYMQLLKQGDQIELYWED